MTRSDWTLLVLAAAEGAPLQPVQLQKVLFMLGKRLPHEVADHFYHFEPYHYGPFDADVYRDAEYMAAQGLVTIGAGRWKTYAATPSGYVRAQKLAAERPAAARFVGQLVGWARSLSFEQLVKSVYAEFPEYRVRSVFRD
jgi:hypothetical protein